MLFLETTEFIRCVVHDHFLEVLEESNFERSPWTILYHEDRKANSRFDLHHCIDRLREFLDQDLKRPAPVVESNLIDSDFHLDRFNLEDVADKIVFMEEGYVVEEGTPEQVLKYPKEIRTKQFLENTISNSRNLIITD